MLGRLIFFPSTNPPPSAATFLFQAFDRLSHGLDGDVEVGLGMCGRHERAETEPINPMQEQALPPSMDEGRIDDGVEFLEPTAAGHFVFTERMRAAVERLDMNEGEVAVSDPIRELRGEQLIQPLAKLSGQVVRSTAGVTRGDLP